MMLTDEQAGALRAAISEFPEDEDAVWKVLGDTCELYSIVCVSAKLLSYHSECIQLRAEHGRLRAVVLHLEQVLMCASTEPFC